MRLGALALAAVAFAAAAPARAQTPQEAVKSRIAEGEKRYGDQEYPAAIEVFTTVAKDAVATRDQRARAYEYLGMSWLILGKQRRARAAFEELLAIDPHYTLSDTSHSPKLREFFENVRSSFVPGYGRAAGEAELEHSAPTGASAGHAVEIEAVVLRGAQLTRDVVLHWRVKGLLSYKTTKMRGEGNRFRLSFSPPRDQADYTLDYFLEAHDADGRVVGRVASPEQPLSMPVRGIPMPWYRRWYVWAGVGAVVIGAAVGGIVAGTAEHAPKGSLPPGQVSLGLLRF